MATVISCVYLVLADQPRVHVLKDIHCPVTVEPVHNPQVYSCSVSLTCSAIEQYVTALFSSHTIKIIYEILHTKLYRLPGICQSSVHPSTRAG